MWSWYENNGWWDDWDDDDGWWDELWDGRWWEEEDDGRIVMINDMVGDIQISPNKKL